MADKPVNCFMHGESGGEVKVEEEEEEEENAF